MRKSRKVIRLRPSLGEAPSSGLSLLLEGGQKGFTKIPNSFFSRQVLGRLNRDAGPLSVVVLLVLFRHSWGYHNTHAEISLRRLASICGVHVRTLRRCLKTLEKLGYLEIHEGGPGKCNRYEILPED